MEYKPTSVIGHHYIIVAIDYFTKWAEDIPTFNCTAMTTTFFFLNHVISLFGVPKLLISDHGKHLENEIFEEFSLLLGVFHAFTIPYYPRANGQVEEVNNILKTMLQCSIDKNHSNWHNQLYSALWAYRTTIKTTTGFTPFHLVHGMEAVLPIKCEIPTLRMVVDLLPDTSPLEQRLLFLDRLDEDQRASL